MTTTITIGSQALRQALRTALCAASRDDSRPELHAVYWHGTPDQLVLIGTDGFHLIEVACPCTTTAPVQGLLAYPDMRALCQMLKHARGTSTITITESAWVVTHGSMQLTLMPLPDALPPYQRVWEVTTRAKPTLVDPRLLRRVLKYAPTPCQITTLPTGVMVAAPTYRAVVMAMTKKAKASGSYAATSLIAWPQESAPEPSSTQDTPDV